MIELKLQKRFKTGGLVFTPSARERAICQNWRRVGSKCRSRRLWYWPFTETIYCKPTYRFIWPSESTMDYSPYRERRERECDSYTIAQMIDTT